MSFFDYQPVSQRPNMSKKRSFQRSHWVAMTSLERASPRANMMPSQVQGPFVAGKFALKNCRVFDGKRVFRLRSLSETTFFSFSWMQHLTFLGISKSFKTSNTSPIRNKSSALPKIMPLETPQSLEFLSCCSPRRQTTLLPVEHLSAPARSGRKNGFLNLAECCRSWT